MATIDDLSIKIKTESGNTVRSINAITKALNKLNSACQNPGFLKLSNAFDKATININNTVNATNKLNTSMGALGKTIGGLFIFKKFIDLIKNSLGELINYEETMDKVAITMGKFGKSASSIGQYSMSASEMGEAVESAFGLDKTAWMDTQSTLFQLAKGFGATGDQAAFMSQQLMQVGYDLGALRNDIEGTMTALKSGFTGEIEPARNLGIVLNKNVLEQKAWSIGLNKSLSEMSEYEKMTLRYLVIMEQTQYAQNSMVKEYENAATAIQRVKSSVTMLYRALGSLLLPIFNAVLPVVIALVNALKTLVEIVMGLFGIKYPEIEWTNADVVAGVNDYSDALDDATGSAKALKKQLAGFDEINNLTTPTPSGSGGSSVGGNFDFGELPEYDFFKGLDEKVDKLKVLFEAIVPIIMMLGSAFLSAYLVSDKFVNSIKNIWSSVSGLFGLLKAHPVAAIIGAIVGLITYLVYLYNTNEEFRNKVNEIFASVMNWISTAWESIKTFGTNLVNGMVNIYHSVVEWLSNVWSSISAFFVNLWDGIKNGVKDIVDWISSIVDTVVGWIQYKIELIKIFFVVLGASIFAIFTKVKDDVVNGFNWVMDNIVKPALNAVLKFFGDIWNTIKKVLDAIGTAVDKLVNGVIKPILNGLLGFIERTINSIASGINWLIRKLNNISFKTPDWIPLIGGKSWGFNISQIAQVTLPRLAYGGVVDRPTVAEIGEDGAEAVVPLHKTQWMNVVAQGISSEMGMDNGRVEDLLEQLIEVVANKPTGFNEKDVDKAYSYVKKQQRVMGGAY